MKDSSKALERLWPSTAVCCVLWLKSGGLPTSYTSCPDMGICLDSEVLQILVSGG